MKNGNNDKVLLKNLIKNTDPNNVSYILFSEDATALTNDISFNEPFIVEGLILGLCIKGYAKIKINFKEYELGPDSILTIFPSQIVKAIEKSDDFFMESLYVSFDYILSLPLPRQFQSELNIRNYPCLPVSKTVMKGLLEYYAFIVKRYNEAEPAHRDMIIKGLLFSLIVEFISIYKLNKTDEKPYVSTRQEELTEEFLKLLMTNCKEERSVSFYADKLCVTRKYLSATVKDVTGKTVLEWIHLITIIIAKLILKGTKKSVLEISEEMGFPNSSFFCKLFKEHTGMSPLEYRNLKD